MATDEAELLQTSQDVRQRRPINACLCDQRRLVGISSLADGHQHDRSPRGQVEAGKMLREFGLKDLGGPMQRKDESIFDGRRHGTPPRSWLMFSCAIERRASGSGSFSPIAPAVSFSSAFASSVDQHGQRRVAVAQRERYAAGLAVNEVAPIPSVGHCAPQDTINVGGRQRRRLHAVVADFTNCERVGDRGSGGIGRLSPKILYVNPWPLACMLSRVFSRAPLGLWTGSG